MKRTGSVRMGVGVGQAPWPLPRARAWGASSQLPLHCGSEEREVSGKPGTVVTAKGSEGSQPAQLCVTLTKHFLRAEPAARPDPTDKKTRLSQGKRRGQVLAAAAAM